MRKGYWTEYWVKKELEKKYGEGNVLKLAIGQAIDYICFSEGNVAELVEVKKRKGKYYFDPKTRSQNERAIKIAKAIRAPYRIYIREGAKLRIVTAYEPEIVEEGYARQRILFTLRAKDTKK